MKEDILKFISEIERIRDGHKMEAAIITGRLHWQVNLKTMHESKAAAYDFVVRKLKRQFKLTNHEKKTNT